jgi:glyoxylate reductase
MPYSQKSQMYETTSAAYRDQLRHDDVHRVHRPSHLRGLVADGVPGPDSASRCVVHPAAPRYAPGMNRIVVTRSVPTAAIRLLDDAGTVWVWPEDRPIPRETLLREVADANGLYSMLTDEVDQELINMAPALRAVSTMAVGTDNIDLEACTAAGIPVGHTPDVLTETTADMAFTLLLAAARRIREGIDYVADGHWRLWEPNLLLGTEVHGTTLGIVGLGRIGSAIGRRALGFGMRIIYTGRRRRADLEDLGVSFRTFEELLGESDHIVVSCPLTPETHHLFDHNAFRLMKPVATLTNIARGPIIDPRALEWALRTGEIAAAALDVTEPEPIPPDDPLLDLPNCLIVPHLGSATTRTREAMAVLASRNLVAGLRGEPLPACANPDVYRDTLPT